MKYCLGTVQFGLNYGIQNNGKPTEQQVGELLKTAILNDIAVFDTAASYGNSEEILGRFLARNCNKDIKVISKISSDVLADINDAEFLPELNKHIQTTLSRLQINKLYGMLYHDSKSVNYPDRINTLLKAKSSNKVEKIGVSIYTPTEALKALEYDIDIIQVPYNLFDNRLDKVNFFKKAKEKGIEIYARSSLLQGLALMDESKLPTNMLFAKEYIEKFNNLCSEYNIDRLSAAVNYVASNEYIDYVVFGVDNMEQLLQYISIRNNNLSSGLIEDIKKEFDDVPEKLVNPILWK